MSPSVGILTDNTIQFTRPTFPGRALVHTVNLESHFNLISEEQEPDCTVASLPTSTRGGLNPRLDVLSVEDFRQIFYNLGQQHNEIIAILHSAELSPMVQNATEAADSVRGRVAVQVIDSQTISVGLGYLVQFAAEAAENGISATEIERQVRGLIPHIYSVFCIPGTTYLYHSGFLGEAQALVGEMLGVLPLFTLEEGRLTSLEKVRNTRHLLDFLQEFLDEFDELDLIAVIQSSPQIAHEIRTLKEHATLNFAKTPFSEHPLNLPLATLFGPRTIGVFAIETVA